VAFLEQWNEVDMFEHVVAEKTGEVVVGKGQRQNVQVMNHVDPREWGDVEIDPTGADVGAAAEIELGEGGTHEGEWEGRQSLM
jgi:hypothetical protein